MDFLLLIAVLPAIALMFYVYKKDKVEKEPVKLIVRLFLLGMVAGPLAAIVENLLFALFESVVPSGTLLLILEFFIGVAAVEEGFKYLFLNTVRKNPNFNYVFDGIVYAVAVALGFAALENVLYVFEGGIEVAVMRAIFSVPGHGADGVVMGCFFGLARHHEVNGRKSTASLYYLLAFILPTIEHGFYDTALSSEVDELALVAMAFQLAFIILAFILVKNISKTDRPIAVGADGQTPLNSPSQDLPVTPQYQQPTAPQFQQPASPQYQQPTMADWEQANQQDRPYPPYRGN